jgi:hypothetical protein
MVKSCGLIHTNTFTKGKNKVDPAPKHPQRHVEDAEVNFLVNSSSEINSNTVKQIWSKVSV